MQKIVFLDIDGVLVRFPDGVHKKRLFFEDPVYPKLYRWDAEPIAEFNRIIAATGADVVISSSWRNIIGIDDVQSFQGLMQHRGVHGQVIGMTPRKMSAYRRSSEIGLWLLENPCPEGEKRRFAILDDTDEASSPHIDPHYFARTNPFEGLHHDDATAVIEWLNAVDTGAANA